jgi:hypothetical protein
MNMCRVVYKPDGQVSVIHPAPKARRGKETAVEHLERYYQEVIIKKPALSGLDYDDMDSTALPDRKDREKWRGSKGGGVSIDVSVVTLKERRQAIEDVLDLELVKGTPDAIVIARLNRQLDKGDY